MDTSGSEWEDNMKFSEDQAGAIALKKYNNLLTSARWSTKDPKNAHIPTIVGVKHNLMDSKKTSYKPNSQSTNIEPA